LRFARKIDYGKSEKPLENPLILVEGDRIASVQPWKRASGVQVIDLGTRRFSRFIDAHAHLLLHGDTTPRNEPNC